MVLSRLPDVFYTGFGTLRFSSVPGHTLQTNVSKQFFCLDKTLGQQTKSDFLDTPGWRKRHQPEPRINFVTYQISDLAIVFAWHYSCSMGRNSSPATNNYSVKYASNRTCNGAVGYAIPAVNECKWQGAGQVPRRQRRVHRKRGRGLVIYFYSL